jgi:hypothetical protein
VSSTWTFEAVDGGTCVTIDPEFKTRTSGVIPLASGIIVWSWWTTGLPRFGRKVDEPAKAEWRAWRLRSRAELAPDERPIPVRPRGEAGGPPIHDLAADSSDRPDGLNGS